jgi:hypothetical protein
MGADYRLQLLRLLAKADATRGVAFTRLAKPLLEENLLTVCDADGVIEFGTRNHCFIGVIGAKLNVESGYSFGAVTGPGRKPMRDILAEAMNYRGDQRIALRVRITSKGRIEAARHVMNGASGMRHGRDTDDRKGTPKTSG